jgi:hypothetical protein
MEMAIIKLNLLILAAFLALFVFGAWHGISSGINAFSRLKWPTVTADILDVSFIVERVTGDLGKIYLINARYRFTVDGQSYESTSVADRDNFTATGADILEAFGSHKPTNVQVSYNPSTPSESYVYLSKPWKYVALAFMCSVFFILSILIYFRLNSGVTN